MARLPTKQCQRGDELKNVKICIAAVGRALGGRSLGGRVPPAGHADIQPHSGILCREDRMRAPRNEGKG